MRTILALALLLLATGEALAEQRIALVIGNSAYADSPLANPANDARLMASLLRQHGFEVIEKRDAGRREMGRAVKAFGERLAAVGSDAVGLFYFAGHGVQVGGINYLVPVDADIDDAEDVPIEAVSADYVLGIIEASGNRLNLMFLDACRNNPYLRTSRNAQRGLALMNAPSGIFIGYATAPGDVAADGRGTNSPFTEAMAAAMSQPGEPIESMFKRVRVAVMEATQGDQTPWSASSLTGDFAFVPGTAMAPVTPSLPDAGPAGQSLAVWDRIAGSDRAADFESFLTLYPDSPMASFARNRLAELNQTAMVAPPSAPVGPPAGDSFRDCPACPEMVMVPPGSFQMGSPSGEEGRWDDEGPQHRVTIDQPFAVGRYEVTFAEWGACLSAGGCAHRPEDEGWGRGDRPVVNVSWLDAQEYMAWLSRETGRHYRLLTEAEWEYAARAGTRSRYGWGDRIGRGNANCDGCGSPWDAEQAAPVGSFSPNRFGLYDMLGNVWEWTEDCWHGNYFDAPSRAVAWEGPGGCSRVLRGGSWADNPAVVRAAVRNDEGVGLRNGAIGFRVARTAF